MKSPAFPLHSPCAKIKSQQLWGLEPYGELVYNMAAGRESARSVGACSTLESRRFCLLISTGFACRCLHLCPYIGLRSGMGLRTRQEVKAETSL